MIEELYGLIASQTIVTLADSKFFPNKNQTIKLINRKELQKRIYKNYN